MLRRLTIIKKDYDCGDYQTIVTDNGLLINFKTNCDDYEIDYSEEDYSQTHIIIKGGNQLRLCKHVTCKTIEINTNSVDLNNDINAEGLRLTVNQGSIRGKLRLQVMDVNINYGGTGIENHGHLYVDKVYQQTHGYFKNLAIFYAKFVAIKHGSLILNSENASWNSHQGTNLEGIAFINYGRFHGSDSAIDCGIIEIKHQFQGTVVRLQAKDFLYIDKDAYINCKAIVAHSKDMLMLEGMIANAEMVLLFGKDLCVTDTAKFEDCQHIQLSSDQILKCQKGISFTRVNKFVAVGLYLDVACSITARDTIALQGLESNVIHIGVVLSSQLNQLSGRYIYFYAKSRGQLEFPDLTERLYLAHQSTIDGCSNLHVRAIIVESYGKVVTFTNDVLAKNSIITGASSSLVAVTSTMESEFIQLAGRCGVLVFKSKAGMQICVDASAEFVNALSDISAPFLKLAGLINGALQTRSNVLLNNSKIKDATRVELSAADLLVNTRNAELEAESSKQSSATLLHYGKFNTATTAEESGKEVFHASESIAKANNNRIDGEEVALAGLVQGDVNAAIAANNIALLKGNKLAGGKVTAHSQSDIKGELELDSRAAEIVAKKRVDITEGNAVVDEVLVVAGRDVALNIQAKAQAIQLLPIKETKDSKSSLTLEGSYEVEELVEKFSHADIAANLKIHSGILDSEDIINIKKEAHVEFGSNLALKSDTSHIAGKISQPVGPREEKAGLIVQSKNTHFTETSQVATQVPIHVDADTASYDGGLQTSTLYNRAENTSFGHHCTIDRNTGEIVLVGKSDNSTVTVSKGAHVSSQSFRASDIYSMNVEGELSPQDMALKLKKLHIATFGKLGSLDTKMFIESDYVTLHGRLEADTAYIKVARVFLQNGLRGQATIKARNINIESVVYANLFGRTHAHQFSVSSFIALFLGIEFTNYKVSNSFIKVGFSLRAPQPEFLVEAITKIKTGEIELLSGQFLQNSLQTFLALMQPIFPVLTATAGLGINAYYFYNNLAQLYKNINELREKDDIRLVDLLPALVGVSNAINSGVGLASNASVLYDKFKHTFQDTFSDLKDYLENDLAGDIKDAGRVHSDKNDSEHPSMTKDDNKSKDTGKKPEEDKNDMPAPTRLESWTKWWHDLDGRKFAHEVFSRAIVPACSVFMPSTYENAIFNFNVLNPALGFTNSQRGVFTFTAASPFVGAVCTETGYAVLGDWNHHVSYVESLNGYYVHKGADSYAHDFSVHSHAFSLGKGNKVRAANAYIKEDDLKAHDVKGETSLTLEYNTTANEDALLQLVDCDKEDYSLYQPDDKAHATVHYKASHGLKFTHNIELPWSCIYEGTDIYVEKGVTLKSNAELLGLVSTEDSIINNGSLKSKTIYEDSADKIEQLNGSTESEHLLLHARNDINLIRSNNICDDGAIISDRGSILVEAGKVKFNHFGYVSAHNEVVAKCNSTDIKTHGEPDKKYTPGEILGGDGKDHDCLGLYVTAHKIWSIGSTFGADRNYFLEADSIVGDAEYNDYLKHHHKHRNALGKKSESFEYDVRIQRPTFTSKNGRGILRAKRGNVSTLCAEFNSKFSTYIFSHDKPEFRDMKVRKERYKESSFMGVNYYKNHHIRDKMEGQIFNCPNMLNVESYDDIVIKNSSIKTDLLVTDSWTGKTVISWDKEEHFDETTKLTVSANVGPFRYNHDFDSHSEHRDSFSVEDPLLSGISGMKHSKGKDGKVCSVVNLTEAAVGKFSSPVNTSCGINVGKTHTVSRYQTMSDRTFEVGTWHDFSAKGVGLSGVRGSVGMLDIHCGNTLTMDGQVLDYNSKSSTKTLGASFDPFTNRLDASASITEFKSKGRTAAPCQVNVAKLILRNKTDIYLNNAQLKVGDLHGNATVKMTSEFDNSTQSYSSFSASTNGSMNAAHGNVREHAVNSPSFFEVDDMSDAHISKVDSLGGELRGKGFKDHQPDEIHQTNLKSSHHESGFNVGFNVREPSVTHVGYTNSVDSFSTGGKHKHHGTNIDVDVPIQTFNMACTFFARKQEPVEAVKVVEEPQTVAEVTAAIQTPVVEEEIIVAGAVTVDDNPKQDNTSVHTDFSSPEFLNELTSVDIPEFQDVEGQHDSTHPHHLPHLPEFPSEAEGTKIFEPLKSNFIDGISTKTPNRFLIFYGDQTYTGLRAGCLLLTAYTATKDAILLHQAYETSLEQHSIHPVMEEANRIAFSWTGAIQAGKYALPYLTKVAETSLKCSNPWRMAAVTLGMITANTLGYNVSDMASHYIYKNTVNSVNIITDSFCQSAKVSYQTFKHFGQTFFHDFRPPVPIGAPVPIWTYRK